MLDLMIKNIYENSNKIDDISKQVKMNNFKCALMAFTLYGVISLIKKQKDKMEVLEKEIEEMKSKGE